ncbi:MAG: hypothetical protein KKD56_07645 [Acidobacteria bacterium]|nr:hypothetical protein [Acidobacteriota bacterium]MBU1474566.1 hypothetical protein [Acidobacteriota bacterium]MBU2438862.1 hypothetical protein [Acidobacteriota bacterium]
MDSVRTTAGEEAQKIHEAIFGRPAPDIIQTRYAEACLTMEGLNTPEWPGLTEGILGRVRDLEALELAARWRGRLTPLVLRFRLMVRLAETRPENRDLFINLRRRRMAGWAAAVYGGLRTAFKLIKGLFLLWRVRRA